MNDFLDFVASVGIVFLIGFGIKSCVIESEKLDKELQVKCFEMTKNQECFQNLKKDKLK